MSYPTTVLRANELLGEPSHTTQIERRHPCINEPKPIRLMVKEPRQDASDLLLWTPLISQGSFHTYESSNLAYLQLFVIRTIGS